jgi:beta-galactosidase
MHERNSLFWFLACSLLMTASSIAAPPELPIGEERRVSFDSGWRFFKGEAGGAQDPAFDDSAWRALDLPI